MPAQSHEGCGGVCCSCGSAGGGFGSMWAMTRHHGSIVRAAAAFKDGEHWIYVLHMRVRNHELLTWVGIGFESIG